MLMPGVLAFPATGRSGAGTEGREPRVGDSLDRVDLITA